MDAQSFDRLTAALARRPSRRRALGLLAGGGLAGFFGHLASTSTLARQRSDRDGDGLYDDDETDYYGTDPLSAPGGGGQTTGGGQPTGGPPAGGGGVGERPGATGCAPGLTLCSGFCVDLTNDFYNCGLCNNPCFGRDDPRTHCANNFCVYPCIQEGTC